MVELGDTNHAMDDIIGLLQQQETDLSQLNSVYADPRIIETHVKRLQASCLVST